MRVHIFGASGSGTTTLGRAVSDHLECPLFDTDDYYWRATDPPYQEKVPIPERLANLSRDLIDGKRWVLSGSLSGWGDPVASLFDVVVFLEAPTQVRIARLERREREEIGDQILPGGSMHESFVEFIEWAAGYDSGNHAGRSRPRHEKWMLELGEREDVDCRVIRLDGTRPVADLVKSVLDAASRG